MKSKLLSITFVSLLQCRIWAASSTSCPQLPPPTGPHKILGTKVIPLTDFSRNDTLAPDPGHPREILISLYYPASHHAASQHPTPYVPPLTEQVLESGVGIPNGTLSKLRTNSYLNAPVKPNLGKIPTVVFSTGMGNPRFLYTALLEDLASLGYLVVSVDHPYDASVVEFPDGHVVYSDAPDNFTVPGVIPFYDVRVEDLVFVAKSLPEIVSSLQARKTAISVKNVGVFGHSLGGAASAGAIYASKLFKAGINMDGMMFGAPLSHSLGAGSEFLLLSADMHTTLNDTTWKEFADSQTGWVKEFHCANCTHGTYTDQPAVVDVLGLSDLFPPGYLEETLGSIDGLRAETLQRAYVGAFFGWSLKGQKEGLMRGNSKEWPEMVSAELGDAKVQMDTRKWREQAKSFL